jgi:DNA-binding NarL/FixJ family response regulator
MIDIVTKRVIDMIESRETKDVAAWLMTYPNIHLGSRDGSQSYASAIRQAHPGAIQVSDRFHLVKNLTDSAKQHILSILDARFAIPAENGEEGSAGGYFGLPKPLKEDLPERLHIQSTEKKLAVAERARGLARQGISISGIAKELGISHSTAKKYINADFDPANKDFGNSRPCKLFAFTPKIDGMLRERKTFKEIEAAIKEDGYDGAASTIRMYATRKRRLMKAALAEAPGKAEVIERKWVAKLLYQPIEKVKGITESQVERVTREYPVVGTLYAAVRSFKEIVFAKRVDEIDAWIADIGALDIKEINGFIKGIACDLDAVKNAIRFEYNNGLAEGSVNKLKLAKRIMYGRSSFATLRNKLLIKESNRNIN